MVDIFFFRCKEVKKIWRVCELESSRLNRLQYQSPGEILATIFALSKDTKLRIICFMWLWWTERNEGNHKQKRATLEEFCFLLEKHVAEWCVFYAKTKKAQILSKPLWSKPMADKVNINIDSAFDVAKQTTGWGCVARDHTGEVLFAAAGRLVHISEALHAEATALLPAIHLAEEHGMGHVIFETDCLGLAQAINSMVHYGSNLRAVFSEARYLLPTSFNKWSIVHCPRDCNKPAHELATIVRCTEQRLWLSDFPHNVTVAVTTNLVSPMLYI